MPGLVLDKYLTDMAVQAADQSVQASSAYAAELASPGQAGPTFSLYFTPAMLAADSAAATRKRSTIKPPAIQASRGSLWP